MPTLDPTVVQELAAWLYWLRVWSDGHDKTRSDAVTSRGRSLLPMESLTSALNMLGFQEQPSNEALNELVAAATGEALASIAQERNLLGSVYLDDIDTGRSPYVEKYLEASDFAISHKRPITLHQNDNIEVLGKLLIRSPLPAVVIAPARPRVVPSIIRVEDTSALGNAYPLYLGVQGTQQITESAFLVAGVFHIPVPSNDAGAFWGKLIPNATRFKAGLSDYTDSGFRHVADVHW